MDRVLKNGTKGSGPRRSGRMPSGSARFRQRNATTARNGMSQSSERLSSWAGADSSARLRPLLPVHRAPIVSARGMTLATRQDLNELEHRHVHGNDNGAHDHPQENHEDRFHDRQQIGYHDVDFLFIVIGDLYQHGIQLTCGFTHRHHLNHHGREELRFLHRLVDGLAFLDIAPDLADGLLENGVAGGIGGNLERFQDCHAARQEGGQRAGEAGDAYLAKYVPHDGNAKEEAVNGIPGMLSSTNSWILQYRNRIYFGYVSGGYTFPSNIIVFNMDTGKTAYFSYGREIRTVCWDEYNDRILAADNSGYIWVLEDTTKSKDDTSEIAWEVETKNFILQTRAHFPRWIKYDVDARRSIGANGEIILDGDTLQNHSLTKDRNTKKRLIDTGNGQRCSFKISGSGPVEIYALESE